MKHLILFFSLALVSDTFSAESIGKYSKGRIKESDRIARNEYGFQAMRLSRRHYWSHDTMVDFLKDLASDSFQAGMGQLLVGDLSSVRGGQLPGHASHQNGLDADIWFWRPDDNTTDLPNDVRENKSAPAYLNPYTNSFLANSWDARLDMVIKMAASDDRVARIFVNPGIKKRLCRLFPGQSFLKKVRPWWRHHDHFHVRLKCPQDSPNCIKQAPSTSIECNEDLDWWFSDDFKREYRRRYGKNGLYKDYQCDVE